MKDAWQWRYGILVPWSFSQRYKSGALHNQPVSPVGGEDKHGLGRGDECERILHRSLEMLPLDLIGNEMNDHNMRMKPERLLVFIGALSIFIGTIINEWSVAYVLGFEELGPRSRISIWAFDLASIAWGLVTIKYRDRNWIANLNLLFIATILLVVGSEWALREFPLILGHTYANGVLNRYTSNSDGIYLHDSVLNMRLMKPNYTTEMYYNGYTWVHQTDALGFRNPVTRASADIVLLGDSFIYGHGVNIDQTVGVFLEGYSHYSVMNLARQGDCALQQAYLVTEYVPRLKPRIVLYFFSENDIQDLYGYVTDEALTRFIETSVADIKYNPTDRGATNAYPRNRSGSLYYDLYNLMYTPKVMDLIAFEKQKKKLMALYTDEKHNTMDEESIGWRYTKKAIMYMQYFSKSKRHNAEFIMVSIIPNPEAKRVYDEILRNIARKNNIAFIETPMMTFIDASLWLPRDGHLNAKGASTLARIVSDHLKRRN